MRQKTISVQDIPLKTIRSFLTHIDRSDREGCWPWTGATFRKGYGNFHVPGLGNIGAHIVAFLIQSSRSLEPHECVLHKCDNPPCCKFAHLFVGTRKDNTQDMIAKGREGFRENIKHCRGRAPKGESSCKAKLTEADVLAIKKARAAGIGQKVLAKRYGIRYQTIQAIDHGRSWKHLIQPVQR